MTPLLTPKIHYPTGLVLKSSLKCLLIHLSSQEDSSLLLFFSLKFPKPLPPPNAHLLLLGFLGLSLDIVLSPHQAQLF